MAQQAPFQLRRFLMKSLCATVLICTLLSLVPPRPVSAEDIWGIFPEPYTDLYVVYSEGAEQVISIELTDQQALIGTNGSVRANIAVRAESMIAYNLTVDNFDVKQSAFLGTDELITNDFLPIYPGRIYELGNYTLNPGGYFEITATKYGEGDKSVKNRMILVQVCVIFLHLVGADIPMEWRELWKTVTQSFSVVIGPIGSIATILKYLGTAITNTQLSTKEKFGDVIEIILESKVLAEYVAKGVKLIIDDPEITGVAVGEVLKHLVFVDNIWRVNETGRQLSENPDFATATIMLSPQVLKSPERFRMFEISDEYESDITFQNLGSRMMTPEQGFFLAVLLEGIPVRLVDINYDVLLGQEFNVHLAQRVPPVPGVYNLAYQLLYSFTPIGHPVPAEIVVVPENSLDLQGIIETLIDDTQREAGDAFEEQIESLKWRIQELILAEVERRLRDIFTQVQQLCGGTVSLLAVVGSFIWFAERRRL